MTALSSMRWLYRNFSYCSVNSAMPPPQGDRIAIEGCGAMKWSSLSRRKAATARVRGLVRTFRTGVADRIQDIARLADGFADR